MRPTERLFNANLLADTIAMCDIPTIERQLRVLAISQRNAELTQAQRNQQQILMYARAFLQSSYSVFDTWRASFACFEQLTEWFIESRVITDHQEWAMYCWYAQLREHIPSIRPADEIICLGRAFLSEPAQFSAYIYWLCMQNVSPEVIVQSGLLHRYFEYHFGDIVNLQRTYTLLLEIVPSAKPLINFLKNTPYQDKRQYKCFVNLPQPDQTYRSYNLMGELFSHKAPLLLREITDRIQLSTLENRLTGRGLIFFRLFGWDFVRALHLDKALQKEWLIEIIVSEKQETFLSEFARYALNGHLSINTVFHVLHALKESFSETILITWMSQHPFLIYALIFDDRATPDPEKMCDWILCMKKEEKYNTLHHVGFLTRLGEKIISDALESNQIVIKRICQFIFDIVMPYGNNLNQDVISCLIALSRDLKPLYNDMYLEYVGKLTIRMTQFLEGKKDYFSVEHLWGTQINHINLLIFLYPENNNRAYPESKYALRAWALRLSAKRANQNKTLFVLMPLLQVMCSNQDEVRRTLQEAMLHCQDLFLLETITAYIVVYDALETFFYKPFGTCDGIASYAIQYGNKELLTAVFRFGMNLDRWAQVLCIAAHYRDADMAKWIAEELCRRLPHDEQVQVVLDQTLISLNVSESPSVIAILCALPNLPLPSASVYSMIFLNALRQNSFSLAEILLTRAEYLEKSIGDQVVSDYVDADSEYKYCKTQKELLKKLVRAVGHTHFSAKSLQTVFECGIEDVDIDLLSLVCSISGPSQLSSDVIVKAAYCASLKESWDIVKFLCGFVCFSGQDSGNVKKNNVALYLAILQQSRQKGFPNPLFPYYPTLKKLLCIKTALRETLLHLSAQTRCYATMRDCIALFESECTITEMRILLNAKTSTGEVAHCKGLFPSARQINMLLARAREQYAPLVPQAVAETMSAQAHRKRQRPDIFNETLVKQHTASEETQVELDAAMNSDTAESHVPDYSETPGW